MKIVTLILLVLFTSCGANSSPEGRMNAKIEDLKKSIDSLKIQNASILDSLSSMKAVLRNP